MCICTIKKKYERIPKVDETPPNVSKFGVFSVLGAVEAMKDWVMPGFIHVVYSIFFFIWYNVCEHEKNIFKKI